MKKRFFILLYLATVSFFCRGQLCSTSIDTLLKVIKENRSSMVSSQTYRFNMLFTSFYCHEKNASTNIKKIKGVYGESKKMRKIECAYSKAQHDVDTYIDSICSYFKGYPSRKDNYDKDPINYTKYIKGYCSYNKRLKDALLSIRKLNRILGNCNIEKAPNERLVIIEKRSSIRKVVKYTRYWKEFLFVYNKERDSEEYLTKPKLYYWTPWKDLK